MNWFKWKDIYYPYWKHAWKIEYVYSSLDIQWDPNIYFQNIKVLSNKKLIYTLTITNKPDIFADGYITMFWPSPEYSVEDLNMTWIECDRYIRTKYNGQISKGNHNVILRTGMKRFCYFIKDDQRRIVYYSDNRDFLMDKLKIPRDSLYGRNTWV